MMPVWDRDIARDAIDDIRNYFRQHAPPGREYSLVITKLDEALLWLSVCGDQKAAKAADNG